MTPYDTGKVKIGAVYVPPPPPMDPDAEQIQSFMLTSSVRPISLTPREALSEVLVAACLIAVPIPLMFAPSIWSQLFG